MDAPFWALVSLLIFIGITIYMKVPKMMAKSLDERADRIRNELEEARRLREEAQQLLAEYQRKRKEAEREAEDIVTAAEREAKLLLEEAEKKSEDVCGPPQQARRTEDRTGRGRRDQRGARLGRRHRGCRGRPDSCRQGGRQGRRRPVQAVGRRSKGPHALNRRSRDRIERRRLRAAFFVCADS